MGSRYKPTFMILHILSTYSRGGHAVTSSTSDLMSMLYLRGTSSVHTLLHKYSLLGTRYCTVLYCTVHIRLLGFSGGEMSSHEPSLSSLSSSSSSSSSTKCNLPDPGRFIVRRYAQCHKLNHRTSTYWTKTSASQLAKIGAWRARDFGRVIGSQLATA